MFLLVLLLVISVSHVVQLALLTFEHTSREFLDESVVMCRENDSCARVADFVEQTYNLLRSLRVEVSGRLVCDDNLRIC